MSDELISAASKGNVEEINRLITAGANPNFRDVLHGATCLHDAVGNGHLAATRLLLARGADPSIATQNTSTSPLGVAALAGNRAMVELLLSAGARLSDDELGTGLLAECRELEFNDIADMIDAAQSQNTEP